MKLTNATFTADQCTVEIDGTIITVTGKLSLLQESLCQIQGDPAIATRLNQTPHPDDSDLRCCSEPRLVELAARYYNWSNSEESLPEGPVPIAPNEYAARHSIIMQLKLANLRS